MTPDSPTPAQAGEHIGDDRCGFDRNGSLTAGHYVCMCGWSNPILKTRDSPPVEQGETADDSLLQFLDDYAGDCDSEGLHNEADKLRQVANVLRASLNAQNAAGEQINAAPQAETNCATGSSEGQATRQPETQVASAAPVNAGERTETKLREALITYMRLSLLARGYWDDDKDMRVGKLLMAMAGMVPGYRGDLDEIHALLKSDRNGGK